MNLTEKTIPTIEIPPGKVRIRVADAEQPGLYLTIGAKTKTWELKRKGTWHRLGSWPSLPVRSARNEALNYLASLDAGRPVGLTVQHAYDMWRKSDVVPKTKAANEYYLEKHLADWKTRKLESITPDECRRRHERLTGRNGPGVANNALRSFAAWWHEAMRVDRRLPPSPTAAVNWNAQPKKDESRLLANLPEWNARLDDVIANPRRVAMYRFALLSGLRANDIRTMRWDHIQGGMLRLPKPKGGAGRAFSLPLLDAHMEQLDTPCGPWVWPAVHRTGPIGEVGLAEAERRAFKDLPWSPHSLRRVWLSAAVEARLTDAEMKLLVNHNVPGVTGTYIASLLDLRGAMERVVGRLQERLRAG
jgi:integrase